MAAPSDTLAVIVVCLMASFVMGELFHFFRYPRLLGNILAGILLGNVPALAVLFQPQIRDIVGFMSDLAIIFLLLLVGLEINVREFRAVQRNAVIISVFSALLPFALGFGFMKLLGYSNWVALIVGAALSLTAEGTTINLLAELEALNTRVGLTLVEAGILDDVFELLFLAVVWFFTSTDAGVSWVWLPAKLLLFVLAIYALWHLVPKMMCYINRERSVTATFSSVVIVGLLAALLSERLVFSPVLGAFVAGCIIGAANKNKEENRLVTEELKLMLFSFIIPFFFIDIGLDFQLRHLVNAPVLALAVLAVAILGKLGGAFLAKPFTDLSARQTALIGWGMNSRGAIELVIAKLALDHSAGARPFPPDVYSALVATAVVTTLLFPLVVRFMIRRDRSILT